MKHPITVAVAISLAASLTACSESSTDTNTTAEQAPAGVVQLDDIVVPEGTITHYGAVTVADEGGEVSDLVGSFYKLDNGVSAEFMSQRFSNSSPQCDIQDDGAIDFEEISLVYIPDVPGVGKSPVSAGESIVLTSSAGTFATLEEQPAAGFIFYDLQNMDMLPLQTVPADLVVDIAGSAEIPPISEAMVPFLDPLEAVSLSTADSVLPTSEFSWTPSPQPGALLRIFTSTAGGFFSEDGVTVTCLVPDNGNFAFPVDIQGQLGADFVGSTPIISRLLVNQVQVNSTVLYLIRESFSQ